MQKKKQQNLVIYFFKVKRMLVKIKETYESCFQIPEPPNIGVSNPESSEKINDQNGYNRHHQISCHQFRYFL